LTRVVSLSFGVAFFSQRAQLLLLQKWASLPGQLLLMILRREVVLIRPSPAIKAIIAIEKSQLSTLTTVYLIFSPTDLLFNSLFPFKYYFSIIFIIFFFSSFSSFFPSFSVSPETSSFTRLFFPLLSCFPFLSSIQRTHRER